MLVFRLMRGKYKKKERIKIPFMFVGRLKSEICSEKVKNPCTNNLYYVYIFVNFYKYF